MSPPLAVSDWVGDVRMLPLHQGEEVAILGFDPRTSGYPRITNAMLMGPARFRCAKSQ